MLYEKRNLAIGKHGVLARTGMVQARSSVAEHYLDTVGVSGSTPLAPISLTRMMHN